MNSAHGAPRSTAAPRASLVRNASILFAGQAIGMLVPLATIPYLARVLRPEGWAPILVAQALGNWLILFVEYGFEFSGTRAVARVRGDAAALGAVVSGVQSAKFLLLPVAAIATIAAFTWVPALRTATGLLPWTLAFALLRGLSPFWFFQGIEHVRGAVVTESVTKALGALGVLFLVRGPADGWRVLALQAAFAGISVVILTVWMRRFVPMPRLQIRAGVLALRQAAATFAFRISSGLYVQANAVILSTLASVNAVANFGGAERIVRAAINLLQPLTQALFPRVSFLSASDPLAARRFVMRCLAGVGAFGALMGATALIGAPFLVRVLLGPGYEGAIPLIRFLAALLPLTAVNAVLGLYWALPFGHDNAFLKTVIAAAVTNVVLALVLVPRWGASGMCAASVAAEMVVTGALVILYRRHRFAAIAPPPLAAP